MGREKGKTGSGLKQFRALSAALMRWFAENRRTLPWRTLGRRDPYKVWLSEVMLQQTTVPAVIPYLERFIAKWPDVFALARADQAAVLKEWAGLGYYARARNLHRTARIVAQERGGKFPRTAEDLSRLPGIGPYTANAIAAIAFGEPTLPLDGNVTRVLSRLFGIALPLAKARNEIEKRAHGLAPNAKPGDFAEALMDLGATVCLPKRPRCAACPWNAWCAALASGRPENFPAKTGKKPRPFYRATVFWLERDGEVLVRRRPPSGLLGGMLELPSTDWKTGKGSAPARAKWCALDGAVRHTFTHFDLELEVRKAKASSLPRNIPGFWLPKQELLGEGFPTVMKKVIRKALEAES